MVSESTQRLTDLYGAEVSGDLRQWAADYAAGCAAAYERVARIAGRVAAGE